MVLDDFSFQRWIEDRILNKRTIMSNIIIEETTIYEVDRTCMKLNSRETCESKRHMVWDMEYMLEISGCDIALVDDGET